MEGVYVEGVYVEGVGLVGCSCCTGAGAMREDRVGLGADPPPAAWLHAVPLIAAKGSGVGAGSAFACC